MKGGEVKVIRRIRDIFRYASLLLPLSISIVSLLPITGSNPDLHPGIVFTWIMIPWLMLSTLMYFFPAQRTFGTVIRIALYHMFFAAFIVLNASLLLPFVAVSWLLLLLASYLYLARKGVALNVIVLSIATIAEVMLTRRTDDQFIPLVISFVSILIVGGIIILIARIQKTNSDELAKSKAQEKMQGIRMNTLINNLADAVISVDPSGKIELYNAASLSLLNTNVALTQLHIDDSIKLTDASGDIVSLMSIASGTRGVTVRDDLTAEIDSERLRIEVTVSPIRGNYYESQHGTAAEGYLFILRDITKSKSLEEERDEFISVVSHELRTPITIAEGTLSNAKLMLERDQILPGSLEKVLTDAHEQIIFLSKMVNDLSTLSRAERGAADEPEMIDVKELIHGLHGEYEPQAKKKGLLFDIDLDTEVGSVNASHLYVRELLQNLITNAIKYTKEGTVCLKVRKEAENTIFEVKDTGIGISKSDQAKIFNKFYRSEDFRTRETGGTGLGLYVAAKLANKLGTQIEVESRLNHGSTFRFCLNN